MTKTMQERAAHRLSDATAALEAALAAAKLGDAFEDKRAEARREALLAVRFLTECQVYLDLHNEQRRAGGG